MSSSAPCASEHPVVKYSTESTRQRGDISNAARVSVPSRRADGTYGTEKPGGVERRAVLTSSSVMERRRAHGQLRNGPAESPEHTAARWAPLTPRHAQRHLTTLRHRRLRGAWLTAPTVGERRSTAVTSVGCRRRITRTRLGAMAETRVIRAKGFESLPVWAGGACVR
jgi:hypothetical protein